MAGHSKWANIQHRKGREDAKRGKLFTKLVKEITVAAKMGGSDPETNPRLRAAVAAAKTQSMPNDNIKRAIAKATGAGAGGDLEELTYEGYGPGGVAIMVEAVTDNKNRTTPEIRHLFSKYSGNMGESGSVAWQFNRVGYITIPKEGLSEDRVTELVLEAEAEDYEDAGEFWGIITEPDTLHQVQEKLERMEVQTESTQWEMMPTTEITVTGDTLEKLVKLVDLLDDHEDVQKVWNNGDFDESELQ